MTTLPSTTVRYPRQTTGVPALPGQPGAIAAPAAATGMTASDVLRVLRSNMWLIIAALILSIGAGIGAHFYLDRFHKEYTARGWVQVSAPSIFDPINAMRNNNMEPVNIQYEQRTQTQLLRSDILWSEVLSQDNNPIRQTRWFDSFVKPEVNADGSVTPRPNMSELKRDLEKKFSVQPIPDSKLISVSMRTSDPTDAKVIVDNIVNRHIENVRRQMTDRNQDEITARRAMLTLYQQQYAGMRNREATLRTRVGGEASTSQHNNRLSVAEMELSGLISQQLRIKSDLTIAETNLNSVMSNVQNGTDPPSVERLVINNFEIVGLRRQLSDYDVAIRSMAVELGETHPRVRAMQTQRDEMRNQLDERTREIRIQARADVIDAAQTAVSSARIEYNDLERRIEQLRAQVAENATVLADLYSTRNELEDTRKLIEDLNVQLNTLQADQSARGRAGVNWAQQPRTPDEPSFPRLKVVLPVAVVLGLALALGIAFLREVMDTSVRSPRDIARVGQMNLLGMIPHEHDDPQAQAAPLALAISQAPHSVIAEQFRQVRTRLQHTASLETTRSILITSPGPGDGKSVVATNLAAGLALNGRRILLVDANFRRPELHKTFGVSNDKGFSAVLSTEASLDSTVQKTSVPNLDVLVAGAKPANATELLEGAALNEFIDAVLEEYDHVIFDSGPMLFVSETVALAPRVDGVVTVVRARTNSRGLLQRMRDGLRQLKAEHLGVVLNAVRAQAGGYYNRNIKTYYAYQNGQH
ncbi:MAG TPA: polysaccharide biosynthesis tyrosine autokinase [Tepidisphaeraceae bacterium]|nr:polysaccharide biosynthesis tyrosine autokinase [Tepidisphaeraceae bacterium]